MITLPENIPHKLVRSKRRTLGLQITRDAMLVIRAPLRLSEKDICGFVKRQLPWIIKKQKAVREFQSSKTVREFKDGGKFLFLGREYSLIKSSDTIRRVILEDENLVLSAKYFEKAEKFLEKWYREEAYEYISERTRYFAKVMGLKYSKIKLGTASTRWASCGPTGNLNFNWKLIMAPREVVDYVVVHELAHIEIKDHSARFWKQVARYCPNYDRYRQWLRKNGNSLDF